MNLSWRIIDLLACCVRMMIRSGHFIRLLILHHLINNFLLSNPLLLNLMNQLALAASILLLQMIHGSRESNILLIVIKKGAAALFIDSLLSPIN